MRSFLNWPSWYSCCPRETVLKFGQLTHMHWWLSQPLTVTVPSVINSNARQVGTRTDSWRTGNFSQPHPVICQAVINGHSEWVGPGADSWGTSEVSCKHPEWSEAVTVAGRDLEVYYWSLGSGFWACQRPKKPSARNQTKAKDAEGPCGWLCALPL